MFFYVFVVFYTQLLVLMLQYHISPTKHSTVPFFTLCSFMCLLYFTHNHLPNVTISHIINQKVYFPVLIRYVLLCVCCILHTITCTNVTISHINNQTFYRSCVYAVYQFVFVALYSQSRVLMLQYHISTSKHATVPVFIRYVLLCVCCCILHTITCTNVTISHINNQTFYRSSCLLYTQSLVCSITYQQPKILPLCVSCCILHTITSTNVTISHINNQTFYRSLVYTVCSFMFVVLYTQSLVLMLQYHLSTTKHSTVPVYIRYVLVSLCFILHTITSTNVTISHITKQTFYRSRVYTICSFMCLLYFTHNHLY